MKLLIATYHRLDLWIAPEWFSERLTKDFPHLEILRLTNYDNIEKEIADAEIAFTFSLRPEQFRAAQSLRRVLRLLRSRPVRYSPAVLLRVRGREVLSAKYACKAQPTD